MKLTIAEIELSSPLKKSKHGLWRQWLMPSIKEAIKFWVVKRGCQPLLLIRAKGNLKKKFFPVYLTIPDTLLNLLIYYDILNSIYFHIFRRVKTTYLHSLKI